MIACAAAAAACGEGDLEALSEVRGDLSESHAGDAGRAILSGIGLGGIGEGSCQRYVTDVYISCTRAINGISLNSKRQIVSTRSDHRNFLGGRGVV